jgi:hypothetical protein
MSDVFEWIRDSFDDEASMLKSKLKPEEMLIKVNYGS